MKKLRVLQEIDRKDEGVEKAGGGDSATES